MNSLDWLAEREAKVGQRSYHRIRSRESLPPTPPKAPTTPVTPTDHGLGNGPIDTSRAGRAPKPVIRRRVVTLDGHTFVSFDAHALLDVTCEMGRPGMPY